MANTDTALKEAMAITGALGVALGDLDSGMSLGALALMPDLDLAVAAAGHTELVRAQQRTLEMLGGEAGVIEDILVTLRGQYHVIRPLTSHTGVGLFLVLVLDRGRANLAMARHQLKQIEAELDM
ncbi:hypothetical protein [Streptacidiphilus rugosus]|uniref:hypothetical protein n=1 Tax=Streptacidiphilus rugosus TaxID=405783 RepID=UPI000560C47D|nr:hypothetical protein [Streptacidiphilus rugosus]